MSDSLHIIYANYQPKLIDLSGAKLANLKSPPRLRQVFYTNKIHSTRPSSVVLRECPEGIRELTDLTVVLLVVGSILGV
jgi:hypothetical protein